MNLAYGKVLIDSYRRAKNEQMATRARLKNARSTVPYDDLCDLEAILYSTYDPILENLREEIKTFVIGFRFIVNFYLRLKVWMCLILLNFWFILKIFDDLTK